MLAHARRPLLAAAALFCVLLPAALTGAPRADAAVPADFFGLETPDTAFPFQLGGAAYRSATLDRQRAANVGLLRQPFYWDRVETSPGVYKFSTYDEFVGQAARRGIPVMPVLFGETSFYTSRPPGSGERGTFPPKPGDYAKIGDLGAALARRYGPNGTFWAQNPGIPKVPVRSYQIWNEPHLPIYWPKGPNPAQYSQLLRAAYPRIKAADPGAEVVAAGISDSALPGAITMRDFIQRMYDAGGAAGFDTLAVHPYAKEASGALGLVEAARGLMVRNGDSGSKLWVTEFSWGSGGGNNDIATTEAGQAAKTRALLTDLAARRSSLNLRGAVWWIWRDNGFASDVWTSHTGMVRQDGTEKPVLAAYRCVAAQFLDLALPAGCAGAVASSVGRDFVGLNDADALKGGTTARQSSLRSQALLGVQVLRQAFDWGRIERTRGRYSLGGYDAMVAGAAARGIRVLPVLRRSRAPRDARSFGRFAAALVNRYGPNGTLWTERPDLPRLAIRAWQIWDAPNTRRGWGGRPNPRRYASLLRTASRYIKQADPRAEVVTAALPGARGRLAPRAFLTRVYRARGRSGFDTVAVAAYSRDARRLLRTIGLTRRVMNRHRDRRARIWLTSFGWADRGSKSPVRVGRKGQARRLRSALRSLARQRRKLRIRGIVYASWRDHRARGRAARSWRRYTGLLDTRGRRKLAYRSFQLGIRALR